MTGSAICGVELRARGDGRLLSGDGIFFLGTRNRSVMEVRILRSKTGRQREQSGSDNSPEQVNTSSGIQVLLQPALTM